MIFSRVESTLRAEDKTNDEEQVIQRKRLAIFSILLCTVITFSVAPTNAQELGCDRLFEDPKFTAELSRGQSIVHYITMIFPDPFPLCDPDQPDLIPDFIYDLDLGIINPPDSDIDY